MPFTLHKPSAVIGFKKNILPKLENSGKKDKGLDFAIPQKKQLVNQKKSTEPVRDALELGPSCRNLPEKKQTSYPSDQSKEQLEIVNLKLQVCTKNLREKLPSGHLTLLHEKSTRVFPTETYREFETKNILKKRISTHPNWHPVPCEKFTKKGKVLDIT